MDLQIKKDGGMRMSNDNSNHFIVDGAFMDVLVVHDRELERPDLTFIMDEDSRELIDCSVSYKPLCKHEFIERLKQVLSKKLEISKH